jgi:hypothetical protein
MGALPNMLRFSEPEAGLFGGEAAPPSQPRLRRPTISCSPLQPSVEPGVSTAAVPVADDAVALGGQIRTASEVEIGKCSTEVGHEALISLGHDGALLTRPIGISPVPRRILTPRASFRLLTVGRDSELWGLLRFHVFPPSCGRLVARDGAPDNASTK